MKLIEGKDYEFVPGEDDRWQIRLLTTDFVETVFEFGAVSFNEVKDHLSFSFTIIDSPDIIATEDNEDLQFVAARVLENIIENGIEDGSVALTDRETGEVIE